jgi:cation diffusion facilitator family transporter
MPSKLPARDKAVVRVFAITLVLNLLVAGAKIVVGLLTGRITIIADGLHSLLDGANNILGIAAIIISARPPDDSHPYGHRKFENIAAVAIGGMIFLIAWELLDTIARSAWARWSMGDEAPAMIPWDAITLSVLLATVGINLGVALWQENRGKALKSPLLQADARHTGSDVAVTLLSVASLLLAPLAWWVDPVLALGVFIFLLRAAWGILAQNLPAFTDSAALDAERVRDLALAVPGVRETANIRSHGMGNDIHLDMVVSVDRRLRADEVEAIEEHLREALRGEFPGLTLIGIHHRAARPELDPTDSV